MNTEELELLHDSKYRSYINAVDKALKNFEYSSEWADLISALGKLNKVLQNHSKYQVIPKKMIIGKRLAQCLHPALPSGVHLKALETYDIIFRTIGSKRLARDLFLYSSGLFPLLANAAMSAKPALLQLYEKYYLALGRTLRPGLQGFLIGILPGLEEGSEYYDRTNSLLEKTCAAVEASVFHGALWASVLTSPSVRLPAMTYALSHLNRRQSMEDQLHVIGTDIELMVEAVCVCVQDSIVLVQRSTLDLLLFCFPFYHTQVVKMDMVRILSSALHVVLRRDMSLNRRLYAWLLGCDNNGTHGPRSPCATTSEERGSHYFNTYSRDFLVQAMISILKWRGTSEEDGAGVQPNLKPFRILLCLLDKPEIGPAILEDVLIEVFRALHTRCECELRIRTSPAFSKDSSGLSSKMREDKKTVEVVKTANLLFSSFEPYYIWDYISRQFQDCCRMSGGGAGRVRRESGLSEQELTVCELCVLTDFLLDIVSLESYIEIQTGHLPRLLLLLVTCMSRYMDSLSLVELSDMLRLCSKILSRVQPPLVPTLVPHGGVDAVSITKAPSIAVGTKGEAPASSTSQNISISALAAATLPETGFSDFVQCRSHRPTGHGTEEVEDSLGVQNKQQERGHVTQASESNVRDFEVDKESRNCGSESKRSSSELRDKEVLDLSHRKNEGETKEKEQEKNEKEEEEEEEKMEETNVKEGMIEEGWEALADLTETGKTTMQLCVELFQGFYTQFLCRYVLGSEFVVTNFVRDIAMGSSNNDGLRNCELWKKADGTAMLPGMKECRKHSQYTDNNVGALTAACQLFLECSSFPVYVAEGSPSSPRHEASSCTEQFPDAVPMWLQSLLACCCLPCHFGPDPFPTQAVAIGCFLDLLNLTHSVSSSTGRVGESSGANSPGMSECSPSHGRVAVLIVPPLTQCHVDVITRDTLFFQRVAEILWVHLTHAVPKHQVCAVDLLQQLHGLASGSAVCEDVISRDLASHITALRVEAHKKFAVLWHLTRDVQRGKATAFTRTFDRSLLLMLESLWTARDNASRSVALSWLRQVIQRHDIPRILEPLLLLLLHPKTQRVALSYAVHRIQPKTSAAIEVGEPGLDKAVTDKWGRNASNRDGDESTTEMRICVHASTEQGGAVVSEGVRTDAMPPLISVSLRVNPLGSSQSPQSSCESLNDDQENEQPQSTVSNHVGVPPAFQRDEEEVGHVLEVLVDEVSRGIEVEQVSNRSSGEENKEENDEPEEEKEESEDCERECSSTSSECEPSSTASSPERHCGDVEEGEPWQGNIPHGLVRPSSLPDLCVHKGSDVVSTSLTPDGTGESAEAWKEGLVDKSRPIVGSHKSTGALDSSPRSGANSAWQVPRGYGGDAASLEAWYIPGEVEAGESFIDDKDERIVDVDGEVDRNKESMNGENHRAQTSVTGLIEQSKGHTFPMVHPLYQHVLLYLQPYDTGRVVHVLTALRAILYAYPSTFVSAISTTGMSGGSSPRLSWLQDLLTRHHAALSGRDFYTIAPGPVIAQGAGSVGFRSAMYLEVLLSLCLAFLRSHYPSQARASSRDVAENRDVQVLSAELLTIIVSTLARIVETGVGSALVPGGGSVSGSGYASFLVDLLARCKMQRVLLHCLLAGVAVPHLRHKLCAGIITSSKIQVKANEEEESPGNNRPVDILIDESADASGLQTQLLELLQALIVLEYRILSLSEDPDAGFTELCAPESKQQQGQQQQQQNSQQAEQHKPRHHQQQRKPSVPLLRYEPSRPITEQEMLGWTVLHALSIQSQSCSAHLCWIAMVTSSLPYLGQVLGRLSVAVTTQLCHNLDAVVAQLEWEVGLCSSRPSVLLQDVPLDYIVFLLEGVTTIVHHCLLDSFPSPNQTQGNSKFLNEARAALLPSLPTVIMTASSLWGLMSLFDSQGAEGAHVMQSGLPAATTINLGSTKILRQKLLALLSPLCLQHGAMFLAAVARVWDGRRQHRAVSRVKVTTWASQEQMLLVELVRAIGTLHCDSIVCTVRDVMKQPPGEIAREKHFSLEVCLLQFLFAYIQSVAVSSFVDAWPSLLSLLKDCSQLNLPPPGALLLLGILNDFVLKTPPLESKKDQRDLQDITQRLVEAVATVAGSSLEQTTWLRRNLEVKAGPQVSMDISGQQDVKDILLSPVAEMVSSTPSAYSVHALTLLAEVLAHLLDMVFRSDEKEKVVPLLISIMHYVVPYLKNHSTHNAPSYRACVQLLNSLSGYQYTRRAWKKEVFDLFMDPAFFQIEPFCASQWRSIIDHLMTHDKITFRDFMARVVVAQSSSLNNLFSSREAELEQRVVLLKRLAFAIFASELDQYQKLLPDIQERLAESLRLPQMPTLHAQVFVVFRVLLLRISPHHLTSLWPTMITELVQVFMQMEQEMVAEDDLSRNANPSISGLETTHFSGNGYSSSYNQQHWLSLYLSACKFLDLALALPCEHLPQFQLYRWAFITESFDEGGLEVRRQGNHQREFKPYVSRITKLLRKKCKKNCDEDGSWRSLPLEPGLPLLTATSIRSIDHLLPFFNTLCHAFSSHGVRPDPTELCDGDPVVRLSVQPPSTGPERNLGLGPEVPGYWGSRLRKRVEEMVERDFLEPTPGKG